MITIHNAQLICPWAKLLSRTHHVNRTIKEERRNNERNYFKTVLKVRTTIVHSI